MTTTATLTPELTTPCPSWCTLAGRELHRNPDASERDHAGPNFGPCISTGAAESAEAPGILNYFVLVHCFMLDDHEGDVNITRPADLLDLATHAIAAAQWLEAHR